MGVVMVVLAWPVVVGWRLADGFSLLGLLGKKAKRTKSLCPMVSGSGLKPWRLATNKTSKAMIVLLRKEESKNAMRVSNCS